MKCVYASGLGVTSTQQQQQKELENSPYRVHIAYPFLAAVRSYFIVRVCVVWFDNIDQSIFSERLHGKTDLCPWRLSPMNDETLFVVLRLLHLQRCLMLWLICLLLLLVLLLLLLFHLAFIFSIGMPVNANKGKPLFKDYPQRYIYSQTLWNSFRYPKKRYSIRQKAAQSKVCVQHFQSLFWFFFSFSPSNISPICIILHPAFSYLCCYRRRKKNFLVHIFDCDVCRAFVSFDIPPCNMHNSVLLFHLFWAKECYVKMATSQNAIRVQSFLHRFIHSKIRWSIYRYSIEVWTTCYY